LVQELAGAALAAPLDVVVVVVFELGLSAGLLLSPQATMLATAPAMTRTARMVTFFMNPPKSVSRPF
jgi:hypothetical protein